MAVKNKFGIDELTNTEKLSTEVYIFKEESYQFRNIIKSANELLDIKLIELENISVGDDGTYSLAKDTFIQLKKILNSNNRNPVEVLKEGGLDV